jgi:hypothetical protein
LVDSFCCDTSWDVTCVNLAAEDPSCGCDQNSCGDPSAGSCLQVHATPFCDELGCCQIVCSYQPSCCDTTWDAFCVEHANDFCAQCGDTTATCYAAHGGSGCSDADCCAPFVCETRTGQCLPLPPYPLPSR